MAAALEGIVLGIPAIAVSQQAHEGRVDFSNAKDGFVRDNRGALSGLRKLRRGDVLITSAAHSGENIGKKCAYVSNLPEPFSQVFFTGELLN